MAVDTFVWVAAFGSSSLDSFLEDQITGFRSHYIWTLTYQRSKELDSQECTNL